MKEMSKENRIFRRMKEIKDYYGLKEKKTECPRTIVIIPRD